MKSPTKETEKWEYTIGEIYEITINPDNSHQKQNNLDRYKTWYKYMSLILREALGDNFVQYYLVPEVSQPQYGRCGHITRLHAHGVLVLPDERAKYKFLLYGFNKLCETNSVQINKFRKDVWIPYITKDKKEFKKFLRTEYNSVDRYEMRSTPLNSILQQYGTAEGEDLPVE